jgi:hypothetical protein
MASPRRWTSLALSTNNDAPEIHGVLLDAAQVGVASMIVERTGKAGA